MSPEQEIAALRAALAERDAVIAEQAAILNERDRRLAAAALEIEKMRMQLALLRRQQFGRSSEKLDAAVTQFELRLEALEEDLAADEAEHVSRAPAKPVGAAKRPVTGHRPLPAHLPRETIVHEPAVVCDCCDRAKLVRLGENVTEVLETVPVRLKVIRHVRPRYACRICERVFQAPAPDLPITKGKPGPGLIAHIAVSKYCDGLPLYRQSGMLARQGVELDRATLADWIGHAAWWLAPLAELIAQHVMAQPVLWTDDTPIRVLAPGTGRSRLARFWCYAVDPRPYAGQGPPAVLYRYSPDRKGERPRSHLAGFNGYLHADAYAGYGALYRQSGENAPKVTHVACLAHVRRKFFDVFEATTKSPIAEEALIRIQALYAIEAEIGGRSADERRRIRHAQARPLLEDLRGWCEVQRRRLSAKSALGKAFGYALSRGDALARYLEDGRLSIDNNLSERLLRGIAVTRKNYLFVGSDRGGERAAILYTLIESAKLNGLDPELYLADVLRRLVLGHAVTRLADLLPWNIKLATELSARAA